MTRHYVSKQPSTEAGIAALHAQLAVNSSPGEGYVKKKGGQTHAELAWRRNKENQMITYQAPGGIEKKPADS